MADGTTHPIEDVEIGGWVWATDPETDEASPRRVTDTIVGDGVKDLVDVVIDGATITATDNHPLFWVDSDGRWVDAGDLAADDVLLDADGTTVDVDAVAERTGLRTVHNLTVDGIHTYHVLAGNRPVLVHNAGCGPLRGRAATDAATRLGYSNRVPPQKVPFNSHGQAAFFDGRRYITPDVDQHSGGVWKMFDRRGNRLGTYDADLNRIGD